MALISVDGEVEIYLEDVLTVNNEVERIPLTINFEVCISYHAEQDQPMQVSEMDWKVKKVEHLSAYTLDGEDFQVEITPEWEERIEKLCDIRPNLNHLIQEAVWEDFDNSLY